MARVPKFLACPECGSPDLRWSTTLTPLAAPFDVSDGLRCAGCKREFPYVDGVWVLWSDQVKELRLGAPPEESDLSGRVKHANLSVYDDVSEDHSEHTNNLHSYMQTLLFLKALAADYATQPTARRARVCVDVACGGGPGLDVGSRLFDERVGVDISLGNLRIVARKGHTAVLGDAERLPLGEGSVDLVTCFAALHHLPNPDAFVSSAHRAVRAGGVVLTGCDPSNAFMHFGPIAQTVWDARKPIYRLLAQTTGSERFYMHKDTEFQETNDLAEFQRTEGGFAPETLEKVFRGAGFEKVDVFYGLDTEKRRQWDMPPWKFFVLKALSGQNPLRRSNWVNLTAMGRKASPSA
ncbi:MAG: methyltransferase domain-containing protein [Deltaproteobacteria bacterium]|nr:methyltransferase domain-containing protein [Deltaproteobacteria bacterium]